MPCLSDPRRRFRHIIDGGLFTDVCIDMTSLDAFNWFIDQGYLVPLIPRPTTLKLDTTGLKTSGGEYTDKSQQDAYNKAAITEAAIREALERAWDRNHCLVFATGIEHAEAIAAELASHGESVVAVHSKSTTVDDDLQAFLDGKVRWCINYGILTTGFDFPALDCIVVLRVTKSPGLWVQILGRGTRTDYADGFDLDTQAGRLAAIFESLKRNCLILDFGHNTAELGPINDPHLPKKKGKGGGDQIIKTCGRTGDPPMSNIVPDTSDPDKGGGAGGCGAWNHPSVRHCVQCGAEFLFLVKFDTQASNAEVLKGAFEKPVVNEHKVTRVAYSVHSKEGRPDSIKAHYYCGLRRFTHYILPEHGGNPRRRSEHWWMRHGGGAMPLTTAECRANVDRLRVPDRLRIHENKKYPEILDWIFDEQPAET